MRLCAFLLLPVVCAAAHGQHADILIAVVDNQIVTAADGVSGDPNEDSCVFEGDLGELGIPGFTDDPGFNSTGSSGLFPGSVVGFNIVGPLQFWDGSAFVSPPGDEHIEISDAGTSVIADGVSNFVAGFNFAQASGSGLVHQHVNFWVQHPTFTINDPFTNPITPGAYMVSLELTSNVHDSSETFYLLLDGGADPNDVESAVVAAEALCGAVVCPGDIDGDLSVTLSDLAVLLANFGASGAAPNQGDLNGDGNVDLTDLATLLAVFGQSC